MFGEGEGHPQVRAQLDVGGDRRRAGGLIGDVCDVRVGRRGVAEENKRRGPGDARHSGPSGSPVGARSSARRAASSACCGPARPDRRVDRLDEERGGRDRSRPSSSRSAQCAAAARLRPGSSWLRASIRPRRSSTRATSAGVRHSGSTSSRIAWAASARPLTCAASAAASSRRRRPAGSTLSAPARWYHSTVAIVPPRRRTSEASRSTAAASVLVGLDRGGRAVRDPLPLELRLDACGGQRLVRPAPVGGSRRRRRRRSRSAGVGSATLPGPTRTRPCLLGRGEGPPRSIRELPARARSPSGGQTGPSQVRAMHRGSASGSVWTIPA